MPVKADSKQGKEMTQREPVWEKWWVRQKQGNGDDNSMTGL